MIKIIYVQWYHYNGKWTPPQYNCTREVFLAPFGYFLMLNYPSTKDIKWTNLLVPIVSIIEGFQ